MYGFVFVFFSGNGGMVEKPVKVKNRACWAYNQMEQTG
jgi:hypothetical protein